MNQDFKNKKIAIVGCGGLGGYLLEYTVRLGVGNIVVVDGDSFDESNLNRQLLSNSENLGHSKAEEAAKRALAINPSVNITVYNEYLTKKNAEKILAGSDLILDGLDSPEDRVLLEGFAEKLGITIVHGAISGLMAQISTVLPGSKLLTKLYGEKKKEGRAVTVSFTPGVCAAYQMAEAQKIMSGEAPALAGKLLIVDLDNMETNIISLE